MQLPVYLVLDTSASLGMVVDEMNQALAGFVDELRSNALVSSTVRLSIIAFSDEPMLLVAMADPRDLELPLLEPHGTTVYGSAFRLVRQLIPSDVDALKAEGERVFRPVMFFMTDGAPVDLDWRDGLAAIQEPGFSYRPTVIAIGYGSADPTILREVAGDRGQAFVVAEAVDLGDAVESIFGGFGSALMSIVKSSTSGGAGLAVPLPDDWINVSDDIDSI